MAHDPVEWFRIHDASPLAAIPGSTPYTRELSNDNGTTWIDRHPTTAEIAHLAATDAAMNKRHSESTTAGIVTIRVPVGYLVRYTPDAS